jgi:hypothetical protein
MQSIEVNEIYFCRIVPTEFYDCAVQNVKKTCSVLILLDSFKTFLILISVFNNVLKFDLKVKNISKDCDQQVCTNPLLFQKLI